MPEKTDLSVDYCGQQARQLDYDRYLATLFAPSEKRPALVALLAWNLEIAKTRESVSEPMLGHIRLQWWREAIGEIYAGKKLREHPVVIALADAIDRYSLSQTAFGTLLDAREFDMEDRPPHSFDEFEIYARDSSAPIFALWGQVLGLSNDDYGGEVASLGTGWAFTGILRAIPHNAARRRCWLPLDRMNKYGVSQEDFYAGRKREAQSELVAEIADQARIRLTSVRTGYKTLPKPVRPLFLPVVLAENYLKKMRLQNYDLVQSRIEMSPLSKQLRVMKAHWLTGI